MKLARWHTKRKRFISFAGSNHGLGTYGALSISGYSAGTVRGFSPLVPEVTHIPFPYPYRWDGGKEPGEWVLNYLEDQVFRTTVPPDEVAGLFVEPIQGDGGVLTPPKGFLEGLQEICRRHGILFIVDEVQTGFGRTGKMFASEHWKIEPDILLLGKPLGGGTPVSACVTRSEVMDWPHGSHVITGAGHLLGCAGALTMMNLLERERLWENASDVGRYMKDRYLKMQRGYDIVGDVRGMGLLIGVEMVESKEAKKPGLEETRRACLGAFGKGLLTAYDGLYGNVFRITPALNITRELARVGLDIMEDAISETQRAQRGRAGTSPFKTAEFHPGASMVSSIKIGEVTSVPGKSVHGKYRVAQRAASTIELPISIIQGRKPGPTLVVVAGEHGCEYSGNSWPP